MTLQDVKFLHGDYARIGTAATANTHAVLVAHDQPVAAFGGNLFFGQPTIEYTGDKIVLWGYSGATTADTQAKLGEIDLTLDSFLEDAKYFDKEVTMAAIATWAGHGITEAQVLAAYKEAFNVTGDLPAEHSAIVMVMHKETAGGTTDEHSLVVIPVGKLMGDVQTEVDKIEESVGLESDGSFDNEAEGVSKDAETIKDAIKAIDDNLGVKSTGTTIAAETVWAAIEEAAAEKSVVVGNTSNKNLTVTSADTDGKVTYTVNETGLTPSADGVAIKTNNTVAANLGALDTKIGAFTASPEYAESFAAATANAIETGDTVATAVNKLDNKVKALVDEVLDNEETTANAIAKIAEASGIKDTDGNIGYQAHTGDTIISGATNLDSADVALADAIRDLQKTAGALKGKDAIVVGKDATSDALQVSLTLNTANTTSVTETTGGIKLTNTTDGLGATLYWGSF